MRLDHSISEKFGFSGNKSQQLIKKGLISVDGKVITKSSYEVLDGEYLEITEDKSISWVSRSAGKLDGFFEKISTEGIPFTIAGKKCLDIGSSTGGFTQVLLEKGADHVDAVDVGTDQLHPKILSHGRVTSYENTDIRRFPSGPYDVITIDVSFISLHDILPELDRFTGMHTEIFLLFKPQFEVGRENLRKTGVPKDEKSITKALQNFEEALGKKHYTLISQAKATVVGEAGNQEYMFFIKKSGNVLDI